MNEEKLGMVREGLKHCFDYECEGCPYIEPCLNKGPQFTALAKDALEVIDEQHQEPGRVLKVDGLCFCPGCWKHLQTLSHQRHCDGCGKELIW